MNQDQKSLSKKSIKKIGEKFNKLKDRFSTPSVIEIRRNLCKMSKPKNLSTPKIKEIEENLLEIGKILFEPKIMIMMILNT